MIKVTADMNLNGHIHLRTLIEHSETVLQQVSFPRTTGKLYIYWDSLDLLTTHQVHMIHINDNLSRVV